MIGRRERRCDTFLGHSGAEHGDGKKERRPIDATHRSFVPESVAQAARFHHKLTAEPAGRTCSSGLGDPVAENVSILRVDHIPA